MIQPLSKKRVTCPIKTAGCDRGETWILRFLQRADPGLMLLEIWSLPLQSSCLVDEKDGSSSLNTTWWPWCWCKWTQSWLRLVVYRRQSRWFFNSKVCMTKRVQSPGFSLLKQESTGLNKCVCLPGGLNKWMRFTQGWGALLRRVFGTSGWEQESFMTRCLNHQEDTSWIQHLSGVSNCDLVQPRRPMVSQAGPRQFRWPRGSTNSPRSFLPWSLCLPSPCVEAPLPALRLARSFSSNSSHLKWCLLRDSR